MCPQSAEKTKYKMSQALSRDVCAFSGALTKIRVTFESLNESHWELYIIKILCLVRTWDKKPAAHDFLSAWAEKAQGCWLQEHAPHCATKGQNFRVLLAKPPKNLPTDACPSPTSRAARLALAKQPGRCPKILVPPSHPKLDRFSIEKHGFGDPV